MTTNTPSGLLGLRVMVVQEASAGAEDLRELLSAAGLTVVGTAGTAAEAMICAARSQPQVVVSNVRTPTLQDITQDIGRELDVPVVVAGPADRETLGRGQDDALRQGLPGPFRRRDLLLAIGMAVHRHELERALASPATDDLTERDAADPLLDVDRHVSAATDEALERQQMESFHRLAAGAAHDVHNLLTVVNGCVGLALEGDSLDSRTRYLLTEVRDTGARATSLTRQLLTLGRAQVLGPTTVDLSGLVTDSASLLGRLMGDAIQLHLEPSPTPVPVRADASRLEQVVVNLATNARDSMPGGGTLTIAVSEVTVDAGVPARSGTSREAGRYARLTVADTGGGIDPVIRERMYEPYVTTKGAGKGSGLGLAIVNGIVEQLGGTIDVASEPGRGTTFEIDLPLATVSQSGMRRDEPTAAGGGMRTILLVDNEASLRSLLGTALRGRGYTVLEAENAADALRLFDRDGPVHLVVTDVEMPDMAGPELVALLSARDKGLRVLYMSGFPEDPEHLGPGTAFIQKPFALSALAERVRDVLAP